MLVSPLDSCHILLHSVLHPVEVHKHRTAILHIHTHGACILKWSTAPGAEESLTRGFLHSVPCSFQSPTVLYVCACSAHKELVKLWRVRESTCRNQLWDLFSNSSAAP